MAGGELSGGELARTLADEPVLAVCGFSGSGKTTLLEQLCRELVRRRLRVAVLKHDVHGITVDRPGKDSDRLFQAGADVLLRGPAELLARAHHQGRRAELWPTLGRLLQDHDLVLVEGHKQTALAKVWLAAAGEPAPPPAIGQILQVLPWQATAGHDERCRTLLTLLEGWLQRRWQARRRLAGVLIGGASSRMGQPKQLLRWQEQSLLEQTVATLGTCADQVVLLGSGAVPATCSSLPRLPDVAETSGPLAGMLAALRWAPRATWILSACDLPKLSPAALQWLDQERAPGRWAVMPRLSERGIEPLLAVYEPQAGPLLEQLALAGQTAPRGIAGRPEVHCPTPPDELLAAWTNLNRPEDLAAL